MHLPKKEQPQCVVSRSCLFEQFKSPLMILWSSLSPHIGAAKLSLSLRMTSLSGPSKPIAGFAVGFFHTNSPEVKASKVVLGIQVVLVSCILHPYRRFTLVFFNESPPQIGQCKRTLCWSKILFGSSFP